MRLYFIIYDQKYELLGIYQMPSGIQGILSGLPQLWQNLLESYPHQLQHGQGTWLKGEDEGMSTV